MDKVNYEQDIDDVSRRSSWLVVSAVMTAGAWVFALGSLGMLAWALWGLWPGWVGSHYLLPSTTIDGVEHAAFALSYHGFNGAVLLIFEGVLVASAIVMSVLPLWRVRRVGHVLLLLWVGLWLANAIWIATIDGGLLSYGLVAALGAFTLCTLVRAVRCCRPPRGRKAARRARKVEAVPG